MITNNTETVIITVGTTEQKMLCEKLVSEIRSMAQADVIVVSDEDFGSRVGSGGALLGVVEKFYNTGSKLLVINSGGMSKRSINYAVRGKLFANFLIDGEEKTLLEILYANGKRFFPLMESGIVVCCSDIPICTENFRGKLENNRGFAIPVCFETASRHGVMYSNEEKLLDIYPHKVSKEELEFLSSKYGEEKAFADTGVIYFNDEVCRKLQSFASSEDVVSQLAENKVDLNLYPDIVALFAKKVVREEYVSDCQNDAHKKIKEKLFDQLSCFTLQVSVLDDQNFVHIGSAAEALENILEKSGKDSKAVLINSVIDDASCVGENTVLDNVVLTGVTVGKNCLVSDVTLEKCVEICDGTNVCGIRLRDGKYVTVVCPVNENPKENNLWNSPRFYKGKSFTDSFLKFENGADEEKFSLAYCTENADVDYYIVRQRYIKDKKSYSYRSEYAKMRKEILDNFFEKNKKTEKFECIKEKAEINLPVRVNLSGTWTDAMPYCIDNGGQVINMAVTVDGEKPIRVIAEKLDDKIIEFCSDGFTEKFDFSKEEAEDLSDFNLHRAVLATLGIYSEGQLSHGLRLTTSVSLIDKGSGLGTSSILLAGCFRVLGEIMGRNFSDSEIFEMVFVSEQIMKTGGGWQDQAGGLLPGLKINTTQPGLTQKIKSEQISLSENFRKLFSERMVLVPTGQRHFGRFIVNDVVNRYLDKNSESLRAHEEIKKANHKVLKSIEENDTETFFGCINHHFSLLKKISPLVSDEKIDRLSRTLTEHFASAVSVCGAGGGGYLLVFLREGKSADELSRFLKENFSSIKSDVKKADILL